MATDDALRFCALVAAPNFETEHAALLEPLTEAAERDDPDAVAHLAASKLKLHFTGAELKIAGGAIEQGTRQADAASHAHPSKGHGHQHALADDYPLGPGGIRISVPGLTPFGVDIALKIALQVTARRLKAEGKSDEQIRQTLMAMAGGSSVVDRAGDGRHITGNSTIDDIVKSTASVAAGTAQGIIDTTKKIFSHW